MARTWASLADWFDRLFPSDSPRRKAVHVVSIVLLVEGLSVFALFSKAAAPFGFASLVLGLFLLLLLQKGQTVREHKQDTPGIALLLRIEQFIGGPVAMMIMGAAVIVLVVVYNQQISERPEYGDVDSISIMFGAVLLVYPLLPDKYLTEASFAVLFIGFVMVILVVPQVIFSMGAPSGGSTVGNWYVHYMLAAPFAGTLDLIGIPAGSSGDMVTIEFRDGSIHTLAISAYCAGLYSFSIFLSAFMAFVLVFERLRFRKLIVVLLLGLLVAYLGNLLRMVIIGVVGYYEGLDALFWAHENAGWMIFLTWSSVFWWLILRYVSGPGENLRDAPSG